MALIIVLRRLRQKDGEDSRSAWFTQGYSVLALCSEHLQNTLSKMRTVQTGAELQCKAVIGPQIREQRTVEKKMGTDGDI